MRIGQLAQSVGVDTQTIRFYERQGLLPPPGRQENGYRVYTEKHVERLAFYSSRCRILDLSLAEIHELKRYQDDPHQSCTAVNALLDDHISHVRSQITALQALEKQLVSLRARCNDDREVKACGVLAGISEGSMHQQRLECQPDNPMRCRFASLSCKGKINHLIRLPYFLLSPYPKFTTP
jgi:Cd(II)/Pb(II)-responsive transcriptional regulator